MLKDIIEAKPLGGHRLYVRFEDGAAGEFDLEDIVELQGVFAPLRDPGELAKVTVELGTVCWPNGADLDPDVLYAKITGKPIDLPVHALARSSLP